MLLRRIDVTAPDFAPNSNACRGRALGWLERKGLSSVLPENPSEFARPSTPFSADLLQQNAEALLENLGHNPDSFYGSATLRDAFWAFLLMTAHISARRAEVADAWMSSAVDFMMQAALEAYRCHGCAGIDALNECFAVGPTGLGDMSDEEMMVNEIFGGDDGEVGRVFESLRAEGLAEVCITCSHSFVNANRSPDTSASGGHPRSPLRSPSQGIFMERLRGNDVQLPRSIIQEPGSSDSCTAGARPTRRIRFP